MDEFARALLTAEERGFERGFRAGEAEAYNRGWREGVAAARRDLDRLTGEVERLLSLLARQSMPPPRPAGRAPSRPPLA